MKHLLKTLSIALFSILILSCEEETKVKPVVEVPKVIFEATLTGAKETIPNASTETGSANLNFNTDTKRFTIVVTHSFGRKDSDGNLLNPVATMGHIHKGAQGTNGDVVFPFTTLTSPITFVTGKLTPEQEADLFAGLYYVNLHTVAYPGGEIRGNLVKK
jgi:CHRD domain